MSVPAYQGIGPRQRIGDLERESVCSALSEHFAQGRLRHPEFEDRVHAAMAAQTRLDLEQLLEDLPSAAQRPAKRARFNGIDAVILIFTVLAIGCFALMTLVLIVSETWAALPAVLGAIAGFAVGIGATHGVYRVIRSRSED